jgi:exosortase/archaeosortase family protein
MTLQVEGKCSGMNTLFALMFAALLFSYQAQKTFWKRAVLFSFSIPLAVLGNMVRIGLLMGGCALFGQDFAVGNEEQEMSSYHFLAGLIVFVVAYLGLQFISRWMDSRDRSRPQAVVRTRQVGC